MKTSLIYHWITLTFHLKMIQNLIVMAWMEQILLILLMKLKSPQILRVSLQELSLLPLHLIVNLVLLGEQDLVQLRMILAGINNSENTLCSGRKKQVSCIRQQSDISVHITRCMGNMYVTRHLCCFMGQ